MSLPSKVLWSEGLTLGPQQLQQSDLYHEVRMQRLAAAINPNAWGIKTSQWSTDSLENNLLKALALSLVFQDGEIYEAPSADALPAPIDLATLPMSEQSVTFYAAIPALKAHGGNMSDPSSPQYGARYSQLDADTPDMYSEAINMDVAYLKKTVRLLSHLEPRSTYVSFPVVRIRRKASSGFEIDPTFFPPALSLGSVDGMLGMLDNLLEKLNVKIESLYSAQRHSNKETFEILSGDMASYLMMNAVSSGAATLAHSARYRHHHPELVFDKLTLLAGALLAFSKKYSLTDLPAYDHEDPAPGFIALDAIIRDLVDTVIARKYSVIPLQMDRIKSTQRHGVLDPAQVVDNATLIVGVSADMPGLELVAAIPLRFKIASTTDLDRIVSASLSGAKLTHMPQVPAAIPVQPNTYYFIIDNKGAMFEGMLKTGTISIYVPSGIDGLKMELFALPL